MLELRLHSLGHELVLADGGAAAIELYNTTQPDLVLLDLMMPDVDGLAVLKHIRERDAHVPVILVTAHSERSYRLQGLQAGADEFLEKPIDAPILLFVVLGNLDWARNNVSEAPPTELVDVLEEGATGAQRMRSMVEDLLAVSSLEDASFRARTELVSVSERSCAMCWPRTSKSL